MKVSQLGEFGLIGLVERRLGPAARGRALELGIGDDAAAWRAELGLQLATTDTLVEGVHFTSGLLGWRDVGWKALAVNLSDIAAMGGTPEYALLTLGLPLDFEADDVAELAEGLREAAEAYGTALVGGDMVKSSVCFVTVALIGRASLDSSGAACLLRRDAARPGDLVAVTGSLGAAAAALRLLERGVNPPPELLEAARRPRPRLAEGRRLLEAGVRCAIDVSDGLVSDLTRLCEMSGLGATVRAASVPVHEAVRRELPQDALALALGGGEDYELLFTASPEALEAARRGLACPLTVVGEMVGGAGAQVRVLDDKGRELRLESGGWDHFKV